MASNPKIRLTDVHKSFGRNQVLRGVNLDVNPGESVVIIGGSGSGKSVTLKCILGLIQADKGQILVDGQDMRKLSRSDRRAVQNKFGMLFQGGALFDSLPVWRNVCFGLIQTGKIEIDQGVDTAIEKLRMVGLGSDVAMKFPAELSGGMQKRVALARAIATQPEIIFFDEPTTGLDPIMADVINELIKDCVREIGATALTITHDMASVRKIADRVAMIYEGRIIWQGPIEWLDKS
ncbi:MAG: ATP-binding cassette protein, partial [Alphaproteobacteria bacterium]|nr:ATP-binding cassette protein [Alphaproteobacteria bacterium]